MRISPHLLFSGDCRHAIDLYVSAFNADVRSLSTYLELDMAVPPGMEDRIAAAMLTLGNVYVRLSDTLGHDAAERGRRVLMLVEGTAPQIQQAQEVLLEEGAQLPTLSPGSGRPSSTVCDRFGVVWQLVSLER
ncbi:VOC family protein [Microbacterium sp. NPDC090218]